MVACYQKQSFTKNCMMMHLYFQSRILDKKRVVTFVAMLNKHIIAGCSIKTPLCMNFEWLHVQAPQSMIDNWYALVWIVIWSHCISTTGSVCIDLYYHLLNLNMYGIYSAKAKFPILQ